MPLTCRFRGRRGSGTRGLARSAVTAEKRVSRAERSEGIVELARPSASRQCHRGNRILRSSGCRSREARGGRERKRDVSHAEHVDQVEEDELEGRVGVGEREVR